MIVEVLVGLKLKQKERESEINNMNLGIGEIFIIIYLLSLLIMGLSYEIISNIIKKKKRNNKLNDNKRG